jgi:predicted neuraminidase
MYAEYLFYAPPFNSCHAASLVEIPTGLAAVWFGGTREGASDVEIWLSRLENSIWTRPIPVASGFELGERYPCWNPVLHQEPGGDLLLFYKVGPSPDRWWGMLMTSDDHAHTWSAPRRLPDGILGPVKNKPLRLPDGALLCPSSTEDQGWRVHVEITPDLGQTWEKVVVPGDIEAIQPAVLQHPKGRLQLLCRSTCGWIVTSWSADDGRTWSRMSKINLPNPNSGIDAVTLADGRYLLVYNHSGRIMGRWGGPRTPLNLALSQDGFTWEPGLVLEWESGEYSYPAVIQASDGTVHILYTWQRQNIRHFWFGAAELES